MTDREKVLAALKACAREDVTVLCSNAGCPYWDEDNCTGKMARDAMELLKAQEPQTVGGWVSVNDRLPEESESMFAKFHATEKWDRAMWKKESEAVLVCVRFPDGGRKVTVGRTHDGVWSTSVSKVLPYEVTHWMPLPEPPKEVSVDG